MRDDESQSGASAAMSVAMLASCTLNSRLRARFALPAGGARLTPATQITIILTSISLSYDLTPKAELFFLCGGCILLE